MEKIDFLEILKQKRDLIWPVIKNYLSQVPETSSGKYKSDYSRIVQSHLTIVKDYPERKGKYVRGGLLALTAESMGAPIQKVLRICGAMQMSEDWLLIHDDWEDHSYERRGKPALHQIYSPELAVNAGDHLHALMWQMIFDTKDDLGNETMFTLFKEFERILQRTITGQGVEIIWSQQYLPLTDENWFFIADGKTSNYTIAGPLRLGAIAAGATPEQLDLLLEFGYYLGRAFQIRDDYLDITSDFAGLKKQQGNDIYESKQTIMLGHLLRTASQKDKNELKLILSKSRDQKTTNEVDFVINKMKHYGSLDYAQKIAKDLAERAGKFFDGKLTFLKEEPARSQLYAGIKFMVERDH